MYLLDSLQTKERKYYVYRFLNKDNVITYVGRTVDLYKRFLQHDHLTDEVSKIEYIECDSEAEMAWKEVYYINLYYNELSTNISDVYLGGQMKDIGLDDKWRRYKYQYQPESKDIGTLEKYNKYVNSLIDLGLKEENITILNCYDKDNFQEYKRIIDESDILVIPGGNPEKPEAQNLPRQAEP